MERSGTGVQGVLFPTRVEDIPNFYVKFHGKTSQTQKLNVKLLILLDDFHCYVKLLVTLIMGSICDVEQICMLDWTFIHVTQYHVVLSPM
jgi:hypothetical protein